MDPRGEDPIAAGKGELVLHMSGGSIQGHARTLLFKGMRLLFPIYFFNPLTGLSGPRILGQVSVERSRKEHPIWTVALDLRSVVV